MCVCVCDTISDEGSTGQPSSQHEFGHSQYGTRESAHYGYTEEEVVLEEGGGVLNDMQSEAFDVLKILPTLLLSPAGVIFAFHLSSRSHSSKALASSPQI